MRPAGALGGDEGGEEGMCAQMGSGSVTCVLVLLVRLMIGLTGLGNSDKDATRSNDGRPLFLTWGGWGWSSSDWAGSGEVADEDVAVSNPSLAFFLTS